MTGDETSNNETFALDKIYVDKLNYNEMQKEMAFDKTTLDSMPVDKMNKIKFEGREKSSESQMTQ